MWRPAFTASCLLVLCSLGACRRVPRTGATAADAQAADSALGANGTATAPSATGPRDGAYVIAADAPTWSTTVEVLARRPAPIWRLEQTKEHVLWTEPGASGGAFAIAKAKPHDVNRVVGAPLSTPSGAPQGAHLVAGTAGAWGFPYGSSAEARQIHLPDGAGGAVPLPPHVAVWNGSPVAAVLGAELVVASYRTDAEGSVHGVRLRAISTKGTRDLADVPASPSALVTIGGSAIVAFAPDGHGQHHVIARVGSDAPLSTIVTTDRAVESLARGATLAWSELLPDGPRREHAVRVLDRASNAARFVARTGTSHHLQTSTAQICWAIIEPKQGHTAWDRNGEPIGPVAAYVLCAPVAGGRVERAVGPLDAPALAFALDEDFLYWAVPKDGTSSTLMRRAVPR